MDIQTFIHEIDTHLGSQRDKKVFFDASGDIPYYTRYPCQHVTHHLVVVGGIHGDEHAGCFGVKQLLTEKMLLPETTGITCIPVMNINGFVSNSRYTSDGQDPNRIRSSRLNDANYLHRFRRQHILPLGITHLLSIHEDDEQEGIYAYVYLHTHEQRSFDCLREEFSQQQPIYQGHALYDQDISHGVIPTLTGDGSLEDSMHSDFGCSSINLEVPDRRSLDENSAAVVQFIALFLGHIEGLSNN